MESRAKRSKKPLVFFSPDQYSKPVKSRKKSGSNCGRARNTTESGNQNKWSMYFKAAKRHISIIDEKTYLLEVYLKDKSSQRSKELDDFAVKEIENLNNRIRESKVAVKAILNDVLLENASDTVNLELQEEDENGEVDLTDVCCSKCGGQDEENNDILFCDRKGCYRAYHQGCLDPPLANINDMMNPNDAWYFNV